MLLIAPTALTGRGSLSSDFISPARRTLSDKLPVKSTRWINKISTEAPPTMPLPEEVRDGHILRFTPLSLPGGGLGRTSERIGEYALALGTSWWP